MTLVTLSIARFCNRVLHPPCARAPACARSTRTSLPCTCLYSGCLLALHTITSMSVGITTVLLCKDLVAHTHSAGWPPGVQRKEARVTRLMVPARASLPPAKEYSGSTRKQLGATGRGLCVPRGAARVPRAQHQPCPQRLCRGRPYAGCPGVCGLPGRRKGHAAPCMCACVCCMPCYTRVGGQSACQGIVGRRGARRCWPGEAQAVQPQNHSRVQMSLLRSYTRYSRVAAAFKTSSSAGPGQN